MKDAVVEAKKYTNVMADIEAVLTIFFTDQKIQKPDQKQTNFSRKNRLKQTSFGQKTDYIYFWKVKTMRAIQAAETPKQTCIHCCNNIPIATIFQISAPFTIVIHSKREF